jgi:hypothetical protein
MHGGSFVEFNRQIEPVAHELNVTMDGLGGAFNFGRQLAGIGKTAGLQRLVNAQHPLQRRTGVQSRCGRNFLRASQSAHSSKNGACFRPVQMKVGRALKTSE